MNYKDYAIFQNTMNQAAQLAGMLQHQKQADTAKSQQLAAQQINHAFDVIKMAKNPEAQQLLVQNSLVPALRYGRKVGIVNMNDTEFDGTIKALSMPKNDFLKPLANKTQSLFADVQKNAIDGQTALSLFNQYLSETVPLDITAQEHERVKEIRSGYEQQLGTFLVNAKDKLFSKYGAAAEMLPKSEATPEDKFTGFTLLNNPTAAAKAITPEKENDTATADLKRFELVTGTDPSTRGTPQYQQGYMAFMRENKQNVTIHNTNPGDPEKVAQNREEFVLKLGKEARTKAAQETRLKFGKNAIEIDTDGNIVSSNADQKVIDYYQNRVEKHNSMMTNSAVKRGALPKNYGVPQPAEKPQRKAANTNQKQVLEQAKDAVKKGAPAQEVAKRLTQYGYTQAQLTSDPYFKGWLF